VTYIYKTECLDKVLTNNFLLEKKMNNIFLFIIMLLSFSAFGESIEDFEYYTVYSDYKYPSINTGMFVDKNFRKKSDIKKFDAARANAIKKWSSKTYYGIVGAEVIKLKINSFKDKTHKDENDTPYYDLRVLFEPIDKNIEVIMTIPFQVLTSTRITKSQSLSREQSLALFIKCLNENFAHIAKASRSKFSFKEFGKFKKENNLYVFKYKTKDKRYDKRYRGFNKLHSKSLPSDIVPVGLNFIGTELRLLRITSKSNSYIAIDKILLYKNKIIKLFPYNFKKIRLESIKSRKNDELYVFSYDDYYEQYTRTAFILKKVGDVFVELRNPHVKNVSQFHSL
jgi:hypothetical protein